MNVKLEHLYLKLFGFLKARNFLSMVPPKKARLSEITEKLAAVT